MMPERTFALLPLALVVLLLSTPAHAANFFTDLQLSGGLGAEHYRWKDYDSAGGTVARENGSRVAIGFTANNFFRPATGIIYGMEIGSTNGTGDYYGDAWNGVNVPPAQVATTSADTRSWSSHVGVHGGLRYKTGAFGFNALAGVFLENWERDIKDGISTTATPTYGHSESLQLSGARLSGGIDVSLERLRISLVAGPVFATGTRGMSLDAPTSDDNFDVSLKFKYAYFAALHTSLALEATGRQRIGLSLYRRGFKTKPNPDAYVSPRGTSYLQPGIEADSSGLQLTYGYTF